MLCYLKEFNIDLTPRSFPEQANKMAMYPSCLVAVIILLFLFPRSLLPVFARTNRQAGSSAGVLDYCEESTRAPRPPPYPPLQSGGFLFQLRTLCKLEVVPLTNFLWHGKDRSHMWEHPHILLHFNIALRAWHLVGLVVSMFRTVPYSAEHVKQKWCAETPSPESQAGNNRSAF